MFGVEAEDALLLEPLLRKRIIGCQRGRQDRRHDERQDVETVEQDFVHGSLKAGVGVIGLPIRGNNIMTSRRQNRQALSPKRLAHMTSTQFLICSPFVEISSLRVCVMSPVCIQCTRTSFVFKCPLLTPFLVHI